MPSAAIAGSFSSTLVASTVLRRPHKHSDYMTKRTLRGYASRRTVKCAQLSEPLNAGKVRDGERSSSRYEVYGSEVPRTVPGSLQHWKSFGLDLTAMVAQRGLPDFFVTLSAYDSGNSVTWLGGFT